MSIRYKTALIFLLTGLVPFLAVGALVFLDFQTTLQGNAFRHLEAVTNLQESRVSDVFTLYSQGAGYISQQPVLKDGVQAFLKDPKTKPQLDAILAGVRSNGAPGAAVAFQEITITDPLGKVINSTTPELIGSMLPVHDALLADVYKDAEGVHMRFGAPMPYNDVVLARFFLSIDGQVLSSIVSTRDGLGQTGETFLVKESSSTEGVFITPLRFDSAAAFTKKIALNEGNRPSAQALLKKDATFTKDAVGYHGRPVVAVTRYMPQAGLGIVGQVEESEVFGPIEQLATQVVVFAALLILFTIFVGSFMAELFTKPILNLAAAAAKVRRGDFSARAKVWSSDEIGQLGRSFNVMAEDLAKQDRAKSDLIALISHQLRTPVTAVKGFVSLVQQTNKSKLSRQDAKMLELAFSENEKLNKLITQILEVAHAESGKLALKKAPTDMTGLVQTVIKDHEPAFKLREQTIEFTPPPAPVEANIDAEKIGFVLANLLTNASKYSPADSKILVALGGTDKTAWISVTDTGLGIRRTDQRKLFQKFSRIEDPRRNSAEGVGLGLYMANMIVELHKGNLLVSSRENHGSSFTIELPK